MRKTLRNAFLVTTAAAGLVTGITIASAQSPGGGGGMGGGGGGSVERQQSPSGGGGGGGHAQGLGTQSPKGGQLGGTHEQRGQASGGQRESGKQLGEQRGGKQLGEQRGEHGKQFGEQSEQRTNKQLGSKERTEQLGRGERNERLGTTRGETTERFGRGERTERFGATRTDRGPGFAREHSGRSVQLSSDQRTRIHDVFVRDRDRFDRFRVSRVDFDLRPGVRIPRHFHLFVLPSDFVTIVPQYRGYRFFYYEDELVIVDPVTLEIVAIIPA